MNSEEEIVNAVHEVMAQANFANVGYCSNGGGCL